MFALKFILWPFSVMYKIVTSVRNYMYDRAILKSSTFNIPIICVGNLSYGGTGKTPLVEYLIRLLNTKYTIATLSRGYKRKTTGFVIASEKSDYTDIGDEPFQYLQKFKNLVVAVDEDRVNGVKNLIKRKEETQVVLLDDAFQHRKIKAGLCILLSDYSAPFYTDHLIPLGKLREPIKGYKRADIIIVTKCPNNITKKQKDTIISKIAPLTNQKVYFSSLLYKKIIALNNHSSNSIELKSNLSVVLLTGIANTDNLVEYISSKTKNIIHKKFPDHYNYTTNDIVKVIETYNTCQSNNKIILTTEKDAIKLQLPKIRELIKDLPVYFVDIETFFDEKDKEGFESDIFNFLKTYT